MKPNAAIIGASGEILLLRMIADLDPNEGKVFLGDLPRASMPGHALAPKCRLRRRAISRTDS